MRQLVTGIAVLVLAAGAAAQEPAAPTVSPKELRADPVGGLGSDGNGVFEPGETALIEPSWQNETSAAMSFTGAISAFQGPAGATYTADDAAASYGPIEAGSSGGCVTTPDCYSLSLSAPAVRPATHWDANFLETPSTGDAPHTWTLHVGDSFKDVPRSHPFYARIETLLHSGLTAGCDAGMYCPAQVLPTSQVAMLLARAVAGGGSRIPVSGTGYDCEPGGSSIFEDVAPTDIYCKHAHYLVSRGIALFAGTRMLPTFWIQRYQLAVWIARAVLGGNFPALPQSYGPDPTTGRSYNCGSESTDIHFVDAGLFCAPIHFVWAKGIVAGCSPTAFCPDGDITRDQVAKFLVNAFHLNLYGP